MWSHVERFLSCTPVAWQGRDNNKSMRSHCAFSFQAKPWKTRGRFFFQFFVHEGRQIPHLMKNLNKLNYTFQPQKCLRVNMGHSKGLRHIFKDEASTLTVTLRCSLLSKNVRTAPHPTREYWETLQLLEQKFIAWDN